MEELIKSIKEIVNEEIIKVVISNKLNKEVEYNKINVVLKINNKGKKYYQIEKFTDKQVFHENIEFNNLEKELIKLVNNNYKQLSAWSNDKTFDLKISKKGKVFLGKKKSDNKNISNKSHNKEKKLYFKRGNDNRTFNRLRRIY